MVYWNIVKIPVLLLAQKLVTNVISSNGFNNPNSLFVMIVIR